jgi:hypothetical protein
VGKLKLGVLWGLIFGPLFFLIYINDLPTVKAGQSKPFLFSEDTIKIITIPSPSKFIEDINNIIGNIKDLFRSN